MRLPSKKTNKFAYLLKNVYLCAKFVERVSIMYSINDITEYTVLLIHKFAQHYGLTDKQAANYIERYGALSLFHNNYGIMHTLSFDDNIESIAAYCHRQGGALV